VGLVKQALQHFAKTSFNYETLFLSLIHKVLVINTKGIWEPRKIPEKSKRKIYQEDAQFLKLECIFFLNSRKR